MSQTLVLQNRPISVLSPLPTVCWDDVGAVLGRRANTPKVLRPGDVRKILNVSLARMGALVAAILGHEQPYHRSTVWHWEHSTRRHQLMPLFVCEVYKQIIREVVRLASSGRYAAHVANVRLWRVTLKRIK